MCRIAIESGTATDEMRALRLPATAGNGENRPKRGKRLFSGAAVLISNRFESILFIASLLIVSAPESIEIPFAFF